MIEIRCPTCGGSRTATPTVFEAELRDLINRHSLENSSDTPDYILAAYLERCLLNFNETLTERTRWYAPQTEGESK